MLRTYAAFFSLLRSVVDIVIIGSCWIIVYFVRFQSGFFRIDKGIPDLTRHLILTLPVVVICYFACFLIGLYEPKRTQNIFLQLVSILKACFYGGLIVLAFFYYLQDRPYSRTLLVLFAILLFIGLTFSHLFTMAIVRKLRSKGYNLRYYVVIGTGPKGQQLVRDIEQMEWLGLRCVFFIDNDPSYIGTELLGFPVYGPVAKLSEIIKTETIDEVYLALSGGEAQKVYPVLKALQSTGTTIRIIPDWGNLASIRNASVITIGSQILFSAADSSLSGAGIVVKEIFDRTAAILLLVIFAIPMGMIALLIKLSSKGPVFYKQMRMGMDQREFEILKFRTMKVDAEKQNGPQWSKRDDNRCTTFGRWLRRTSLDEVPQLINVVKGQMSMVGPRPERPYFVRQFSEEYRSYMLRHKVKSGMTGWAQIHGFRGDTSLRKRLVYDLYYVRNWSIALDLWILLCTPWHIIKGVNAH